MRLSKCGVNKIQKLEPKKKFTYIFHKINHPIFEIIWPKKQHVNNEKTNLSFVAFKTTERLIEKDKKDYR